MKSLVLALVATLIPTSLYAGIGCNGLAAQSKNSLGCSSSVVLESNSCSGSRARLGAAVVTAPLRIVGGIASRVGDRIYARSSLRASRLSASGCSGVQAASCSSSVQVRVTIPAPTVEVVLGVESDTLSYSAPTSSYQAEAEAEAQQMASRRFKSHLRGTISGVNFAGVGWSSHGKPDTCTPSRGMTLVADATARGSDGYYRVRYWR